MKATKKLLLFAFVAALMITMFVAFAVTASAANVTIEVLDGKYDTNVTYGEDYTYPAVDANGDSEAIKATEGAVNLPGAFKNPVFKLYHKDTTAANQIYYAAGSNVGDYYLGIASAEINGTKVDFIYDKSNLGSNLVGKATVDGVEIYVNANVVKVEAKEITITVDSINSKPYDGTKNISAEQFNVTFNGLFAGDATLVGFAVEANYTQKNKGEDIALENTVFTLVDKDAGNPKIQNYILTNGELTGLVADIVPAEITITLNPATKVYDGVDNTALEFDYQVQGMSELNKNFDNKTLAELFSAETVTRASGKDVGTYDITAVPTSLDDNYTVKTVVGDFSYEITKADLAITVKGEFVFTNAAIKIDLTNTTYVTLTGLMTGDSISGNIMTVGDDVGSYGTESTGDYALEGSNIEDLKVNYNITWDVEIKITPLTVEIDLLADNATTYDGKLYVITDKALFDLTGVLTTVESVSVTVGTNAGEYAFKDLTFTAVVKDGEENETANYIFDTKASTNKVTINRAALTIKVVDTKTYNGEAFAFDFSSAADGTVTLTGIADGDLVNAGVITTTGANAKDYTVKDTDWAVAGLPENIINNYEITWDVALTISRANLTITVTYSKTYDGVDAATATFANATLAGNVEGEALTAGTFVTTSINAGTYAVNDGTMVIISGVMINGVAVETNYNVTYAGEIVIERAELKVSTVEIANPYYYGKTDLNLADVIITFVTVNSETLTVGTDYTITSAAWVVAEGKTRPQAGENKLVIEIAIVDNALTSNYEFVANTDNIYEATDAAVKQCVVLVTKVYVAGYDRYYNGTKDFDESKVTGFLLTVSSNKGAIVDDLTVVLDENATNLVWSATSAGTYQAKLDRDVAELSDTKNYKWSGTGNATIQVATQKNGVDSKYPIRKANIYIVPDADQSKIYGADDPAFGFNYYVEGKELVAKDATGKTYDADNAKILGALAREAGENVGNYKYTAGTIALNDNDTFLKANYKLVLNEETFKIEVRKVTVTPNANQSKVYWEEYTTYTYTFAFNDNTGASAITLFTWSAVTQNDIFSGALSRVEGENVGDYLITIGNLAVKNYNPVDTMAADPKVNFEIVFVATVEFEIVPVKLQLVANNENIVYGQKPEYTFNIVYKNGTGKILAGVVCIDLVSTGLEKITLADGATVNFLAGFSCAYPNTQKNINAGTYTNMIKFYTEDDVTITNIADGNIIWHEDKAVEGTLTVEKKPVKLVFADVEVVYGTAVNVFEIVAVDGEYGFVEGDNFANSFRTDTNEVIHVTTYSAGQPVGEYAVKNGINIADQFISQNYKIIPYDGDPGADLNTIAPEKQIGAGKITVTPKQLVLVPYVGTFDPANVNTIEKEFGAAHPTISYAVVGLIGSQEAIWSADITILNDSNVEIKYDGTDAVGTYKFAIENIVLTNNDSTGFFAQNYELVISNEVKFHIYAATLYLEGVITGDTDKIYNGDVDYVGGFNFGAMTEKNSLSLEGLNFTVKAHFADKNVGTGKALVIESVVCSDVNYKVDFSGLNATATIVAKEITATGITANDKVYNADVNATVFVPNNIADIFAGYIAGDDLKVTATGVFTGEGAKNVGVDKTVAITLSLGGEDAGNYILVNTNIEDTATITPASIIITGITAKDKVYDGTTEIEFVVNAEEALIGIFEGDTVVVNVAGQFADANVGNKKKVSINITLSEGDSANYVVNTTEGQTFVTASITPATITLTIGDADKVYGYVTNNADFSYSLSDWAEAGTSKLHSAITFDYTTTYDATVAAKRGVGKYAIGAENIVVTTYNTENAVVSTENYIVVVEKGDLVITQKVLEVKVNTPANIIYGDEAPEYTFDAEGFVFDDDKAVIKGTPVFNCNYVKGADAGKYLITLASNLYADNYVLHFNAATLTVNKAVLTITPMNTTVVYGDGAMCDGYLVDGLKNNDAESVIRGEIVYIFEGFDDANGAVDTYTISVDKDNTTFNANNYEFQYATGTLTVEKAVLTIVPNDVTITYGEDFVNAGYEFVGLVNGDTTVELTGEVGYSVVFKNVGTYVITAVVDGVETANYEIVAGEGTLTVTKASLTITVNNYAIIYGDLAPVQAVYSYTVGTLVEGDVAEDQIAGIAVYTCEYQQNDKAGTYVISMTGLTSDNYEITFVDGTLTVEKKLLKVLPVDTTITYGDAPMCDGYVFDGLTPYDAALTIEAFGELVYNFDYAQFGNVGTYEIATDVSALTSDNYYFEGGVATLTVVQKALTLTADNKTTVYGSEAPEFTFTADGFVGTDGITVLEGTASYVCDYAIGSDVGEYAIVLSGLTATNYEITFVEGTLTVTKASLTIKPFASSSIIYGDLAPAQSFYYYDAVEGLVAGDKLTDAITGGLAAYTTDYQQNSNAGEYAINVSGLESKNYEITYVPGTLTVAKKALTVKPVDTTITFGDEPTCDGYILVGLTPYDSAITELNALVEFNGTLTYSYNYEKYMNVGKYVITSVIDELESTNYYFVTADGVLTVEAYTINGQITANGEIVLDVIYGAETPDYIISVDVATKDIVEGAFNAGTLDFDGVMNGYEEGNYVGTYKVTFTLADTTKNFVLGEILPATVNVAKRNITIIADDITVEYGDEPVYTVTFDGLADCDGVEVNGKIVLNDSAKKHITLNEVFTIKYTTEDPAGTVRPILMAGYGFESENYNVVAKIDGELTVDKRVIDVTVETLKVTYGEAIDLSKLTYVIENNRFVEGDTFETIFVPVENIYTYATTNYTVGMTVAESGKVTITITGIEAANYELNITYEGVEIERRNVTLTINNFDVMYGEQPDQTGKFTLGAVYGEDKVNVTLVYVDYVAGAVNAGETCVIEATIDNPNYTVVYDAATLTVVKKTVTITVGNWRAEYGYEPGFEVPGYVAVKFEGFFEEQGVNYVITSDYVVGNNVGNYVLNVKAEDITAKDGTLLDNYAITVVPGVLKIEKRALILNIDDATITYGDEANVNGYGYDIYNGYGSDELFTSLTFKFNTKADGTGEDYTVGSPVGKYYIIAVYEENSNYSVFAFKGELTVIPKNITVKANDKTIEFNQDPANAGYTAEGILEQDLAAFEAALVYTYNYEKGNKAGDYVITVALNGEYTNANYNFAFETGTLKVTKIVITVKVNVNAITYGSAFNSDCQITNIEDIKDLIIGVPAYTTDYNTADVAKRGVGEYTVTVSGIDPVDADNYEIKVDINKLVVNKLAIKVNANNGTATYGDATAVVVGLTYETLPYEEDNALFDANYSIEYTYVQGTTVAGTYAITVVEAEKLANYDVTLVDGTLTVSKKAITFTIDAFAPIYYGNAEPTYVPVFADGTFYGTDTFENSFVGNLTIDAKKYGIGTPIGQYDVTADVSKLYSEKYELSLAGEYKLVVEARPVTITVNSEKITYGDNIPEYSITIGGEGFAPGHTLANLGTINEYYDTYDEGGDAGKYVINIVFTENATYAKNYAITKVEGTLTVEAKELVITPDALLKLKGTEDPTFTYTYTGLLAGETVEFVGALSRIPGEEVGTYAITKGTLEVLSNNYTIVLEDTVFTIVGITIKNDGMTIALREDIFMNYYFTVNVAGVFEFANGKDAFGILQWTDANTTPVACYGEYNSETKTLKVNGQAIASTDYSKTYYAKAYVKLADGSYVYGDVMSYSVADYANYFFKVDGQTELKALLVTLLDYGTAAQKYFGDESVAANVIVTDDIRTAVNAPKYDASMNPVVDNSLKKVDGADYNATIDWFGATASFGTTFKINFYGIAANDTYVTSGENANFGMIYWTEADLVDGKFVADKANAATVSVDGLGRYMFTCDDIAAAEGTDRIYAAMWVKDAEGNISYSRVTYMSIKDYAYTMMSLTDNAKYEAIVELGQATIVYIEAAKAYFAD